MTCSRSRVTASEDWRRTLITSLKSQPTTMQDRQRYGELKSLVASVTRLGDLLDLGQLFKAFGNN